MLRPSKRTAGERIGLLDSNEKNRWRSGSCDFNEKQSSRLISRVTGCFVGGLDSIYGTRNDEFAEENHCATSCIGKVFRLPSANPSGHGKQSSRGKTGRDFPFATICMTNLFLKIIG
jgi:hypothetical protein